MMFLQPIILPQGYTFNTNDIKLYKLHRSPSISKNIPTYLPYFYKHSPEPDIFVYLALCQNKIERKPLACSLPERHVSAH